VGSRVSLDAVVRKKNTQPLPRLESPIVQPVAQRYAAEQSQLPPCSAVRAVNTRNLRWAASVSRYSVTNPELLSQRSKD
jgi:hypothetical protein